MDDRTGLINKTLLLIGLIFLPGTLWANESRLALVIGNSSYKESPLVNPQNDANDMAQALEGLGFEVMLRTDADRRDMARSIRDFGRKLKKQRGVGLFYYAGHGLQIENRNFLIPVGAPLEEEDEVPYESIDVGSVLAKMESAGNSLNLLILDACRNNPFPSQFRSSTRGLARVDAPVGSLVVYATAPGRIAADGKGRNGVFTEALLNQLRNKDQSLTQTIRRTRAAVVKATNGQQVPWESSSLIRDFYFSEQAAPEPEPEPTAVADPAHIARLDSEASASDTSKSNTGKSDGQDGTVARLNSEAVFWNSVQLGDSAAEYQAYLHRFPEGIFAELARSRLADRISKSDTQSEPVAISEPNTISEPEAISEHVASNNPPVQTDSDHMELARLETPVEPDQPSIKTDTAGQSRLTVTTSPADARIRIMNIVEKYTPGIQLDRASPYDIYVTAPGFNPYRKSITLDQAEQDLNVVLTKRDVLAPATVALAGGTFRMGCSSGDSLCEAYEKPAHDVAIKPFSMTRNEITVGQFSDFVDITGYRTDAEKNTGGDSGCYVWHEGGGISRSTARWQWQASKNWKDPGYPQTSRYPVTCVSWNDAIAYARWLSSRTGTHYSLPSEAEWEYAARAGSSKPYGASSDPRTLCKQANIADNSRSPGGAKWSDRVSCADEHWFSAPVSSFKPNGNGLHDMQGNVWEWVEDTWSASFTNTPRDGQAYVKKSTGDRVLRGGAWNGDEKVVRLSSRSKGRQSSRAAMTGFRLVVRR